MKEIKSNDIPIIEPVPEEMGYWEIYPDHKIWHDQNYRENMSFSNPDEINKKYPMGGNWMNLKEGDNKVRLVSDCFDYGNHYLPNLNKSVICIGKERCAFCQKGLEPSVQFLAWIIDREDGKVKLFRFGYKIYKQIVAYKNNPEYEFDVTPDYDFTIRRAGTGKQSDYTVIPARTNTEITEEEIEMIEKKTKDPQEIIDKMKEKIVPSEPKEDTEGKESPSEELDDDIDIDEVPF